MRPESNSSRPAANMNRFYNSALLRSGLLLLCLAFSGFGQTVVTIRNNSAFVAASDLAVWASAINQQVLNDVTPVWGVNAQVTPAATQTNVTGVNAASAPLPSGNIVCTLYDGDDPTTTVMGDHFVDKTGLPGCEVNVASVQFWGQTVSVVLSHEIIEMLVNPWLDGLVVIPAPQLNPGGNFLYTREICDPVQGYTYQVNGVPVSDFVYPVFFQNIVTAAQMDKMNLVHIALTPAAGLMSYRYTSGMGLSGWLTMSAPGFNLTSLFTGQ
jgi:hypothetical protein